MVQMIYVTFGLNSLKVKSLMKNVIPIPLLIKANEP